MREKRGADMLTKALFMLLACACATSAQTAAATSPAPTQMRAQEVRGFFPEYALDHSARAATSVSVEEEGSVWAPLEKGAKLARFANGEVELYQIGPDSRPV